uniref:TLC domain-containing protein n=1 Tax=Anguilla anguilla TaxID=7936 RepID=A0A0E9Y010_ANGAN
MSLDCGRTCKLHTERPRDSILGLHHCATLIAFMMTAYFSFLVNWIQNLFCFFALCKIDVFHHMFEHVLLAQMA